MVLKAIVLKYNDIIANFQLVHDKIGTTTMQTALSFSDRVNPSIMMTNHRTLNIGQESLKIKNAKC